MEEHITIDGAMGEGGGQVLRSSLALSLITGRPLLIERIRANRGRPGLRRQHLKCVEAAAAFGDASVKGGFVGSSTVEFVPSTLRGGEVQVDIGTAGSTSLVIQAVLPALLRAPEPSTLRVRGGTHNDKAPPFDFLDQTFLPCLHAMGADVELFIHRHGFFPRGGGEVELRVTPAALRPLTLQDRKRVRSRKAVVLNSQLDARIADTLLRTLKRKADASHSEVIDVDALGPGIVCMLECRHGKSVQLFTGFGRKGVPAKIVAGDCAEEALTWLNAPVPVDEHLADQLLLPMVLAGGGRYRTTRPSQHTRTNADVIRQFLPVEIAFQKLGPSVWEVQVGPS